MKHIRLFLADARRHQGLALIIVLSMLALATIVILAFLSVADTENKATNVYSASQQSRRFADTAVNMVISQIRSGSAREVPGTPVIHATQPGAVRKYAASGDFLAGYKLFSDKDMIFRGTGNSPNVQERNFVQNSEPPADWNQGNNTARYVDLNEPVIKGVAVNAEMNSDRPQLYFPIIDPRAGQDIDPTSQETPVEGFSYDVATAIGGNSIGGMASGMTTAPIIPPSGGTLGNNIDQLRLAMPVQWLYVLKDGAIGYLNDNLEFRVLADGTGGLGEGPSVVANAIYGVPSEENPIVGRIAFWTDDETCKININTASEPTYTGQPLYYHDRDRRWADYAPVASEYQRFPGHPATVAMSTVLYPNPLQNDNRSLDTYGASGPVSGVNLKRALDTKERIYDLMPRIQTGGSYGGTRTFATDEYAEASGDKTIADLVAIETALDERLYASVDELLFSQKNDSTRRVLNEAQVSAEVTLFNKISLERSSAFLTANSRGSEINLFGMPRIAMWPLPRNPNNRTGFDKMMEFCSRIGSKNYIFQREYSQTKVPNINGSLHDVSIPRNLELLNMLDRLLDNPFPTATDKIGKAFSFRQKLGGNNAQAGTDNARQILMSMFDYIRCTNLYDSYLVPDKSTWPTWDTSWPSVYNKKDSSNNNLKTYTGGYMKHPTDPLQDRALPGHGQVTPSAHPQWKIGGSNGPAVKGFGRFVTVSEIGLHFICTADGQPDMYSWRIPKKVTDEDGKESYIIPPFDPADPTISGGRTALKVAELTKNEFTVQHENPDGFSLEITNLQDVHWADTAGTVMKSRFYSNYPPLSKPGQPGRYGTGEDPEKPESYFQTHPGYQEKNWNYTLDEDKPLLPNTKRIQAMLNLELFCPSAGYTELHPDYTIVISAQDMSNLKVNGSSIFQGNAALAIRSEKPLYSTDNHPEIGGFAAFRYVALGRRLPGRGKMPPDDGYVGASGSQDVHGGLLSLDLTSTYMDVPHGSTLKFTSSAPITLKIYDHHVLASTNEEPVQTIEFILPPGEAPAPDLIVAGSYWVNFTAANGNVHNHPAIQAPRWWTFNRDGAVNRVNADGKPLPSDLDSTRGRFYNWDTSTVNGTSTRAYDPAKPDQKLEIDNQSLPGARSLIYSKDASLFYNVDLQDVDQMNDDPSGRLRTGYGPKNAVENSGFAPTIQVGDGTWNRPWHYGSDTIRTLQPAYGDARLIAAKSKVLSTDWKVHRNWSKTNEYMAHNFSSYSASEAGFDRGVPNTVAEKLPDNKTRGLPSKIDAAPGRSPDAPHGLAGDGGKAAYEIIQRYYDFDDTDPGGRVGAFINKPDEGNYAIGLVKYSQWSTSRLWRATYFRADGTTNVYASGKGSYFTPNRMISSPVMMGSLPSRVWDTQGNGAWTNLLFRPHLQYQTGQTGALKSAEASHPGEATPPDHYLLDLFWMPVVEPYAISEPLSTAGKINLNYQMLPFTHIRRATAVHAAMKGELISALPNADFEKSRKRDKDFGTNGAVAPTFWNEGKKNFWHRNIVVDRFKPESQLWWQQAAKDRVQGTLRQFEERFNFGANGANLPDSFRGGLFRTTSQLCEIHLIPSPVQSGANITPSDVSDYNSRRNKMAQFWGEHCGTGDNTRERPYSNLYAKFTTRSNTFRVHVRSQSIRKARRSVAANKFDPTQDEMSAEFRGSFLLERYIDQADLTNLDYAASTNPFSVKALESFYRFRVIESKRFAP